MVRSFCAVACGCCCDASSSNILLFLLDNDRSDCGLDPFAELVCMRGQPVGVFLKCAQNWLVKDEQGKKERRIAPLQTSPHSMHFH